MGYKSRSPGGHTHVNQEHISEATADTVLPKWGGFITILEAKQSILTETDL